jgi:hypothetical protein
VLVMPALRFEWLDADRQHPEGQRYVASGALNFDYTAHARLLLDLTRDQLRPGTYPLSSPPGVFSQSATIFVIQVQLKL